MKTVEEAGATGDAVVAPRGLNALQLLADQPALAILRALADERLRPVELEQRLAARLTRATLHERLSRLLAADALRRHTFAQAPPRVEYELTLHGRRLCAISLLAAHWEVLVGMRPCFDDPQEIVDALAITAPLATPGHDARGTCACVITRPSTHESARVLIDVRDGEITTRTAASSAETTAGRPSAPPDACATGEASGWWDALITGALGKIGVEGDAALAAHTVEALRLGLVL